MNRRFFVRPKSLLYLPNSLSDIIRSGWLTKIFLIFKTNFSFLSFWIKLSKGSSFLLFTAALMGSNLTWVFLKLLRVTLFSCKTKLLPKNDVFNDCLVESVTWDFTESLGFSRRGDLYERKKGRAVEGEMFGEESRSLGSMMTSSCGVVRDDILYKYQYSREEESFTYIYIEVKKTTHLRWLDGFGG
ncbi:hypothetical protein L1049_013527 [Liquidambar formosana]|uniref:Transmembrane protein n=1 Tax=Liquidambar formosana TaxID=63359 RepID=A0AAP0RPF1_LIQFO